MAKILLKETLDAIASERKGGFDRSFALVDRLVKEHGEDDLAERLYRVIGDNYSSSSATIKNPHAPVADDN